MLKNTQTEAKMIHERFGGTLWLGKQANEVDFLKRASEFQILHLATHGFLDNLHTESSFIAFTATAEEANRGLLFASEIYASTIQAELLVLMVCQTAGGQLNRGEGLLSLTHAFLYSGVQSVVGTLWNIIDENVQLLVDNYYTNLLTHQYSKSKALQQAKLTYLSEVNAPLAHPYYWAGFIAIGNDAPISQLPSKNNHWLRYIGFIFLGCLVIRWYRNNTSSL